MQVLESKLIKESAGLELCWNPFFHSANLYYGQNTNWQDSATSYFEMLLHVPSSCTSSPLWRLSAVFYHRVGTKNRLPGCPLPKYMKMWTMGPFDQVKWILKNNLLCQYTCCTTCEINPTNKLPFILGTNSHMTWHLSIINI